MVRIGLVQINNSFSGQNYLPYSIACLQSYAERRLPPGKFDFLPMIYKRIPVSEIVERLEGADVIGFSAYVWNARISLEAARRIKQLHPNRLVIFGGPHVPDHAESFLRSNPFIDLVVHNEGEKTFVELLSRLPERDWGGIRGISYIDAAGNFVRAAPVERMRDLEELPSPFLNGIFDDLIASNPDEQWIGLWETNRGCPFQCTFCDWGSATAGKVTKFEFDRLHRELDWFAAREVKYIFVCDANFGIQKRDVEIAEAVAAIRERTGFPHGFSVQNTKNATERAYQTQKILADAKLNKGVALSMQSLDPTTLKNIKRDNISLETYFELARRFTADKVETYSDIILGLPGETYDTFRNGVDKLIRLGQHNRVQFNNLTILPNAEMGNPDYLEKFGMVTVQSEIINIHGTREEMPDDVPEVQDLVIATCSLSPEDWRKTRVFGWMAAFLHFDKLLQLPMMVACETRRARLSRHHRCVPDGFEGRVSRYSQHTRVLRQRGAVDAARRAGIRLFEGMARDLLAGRRIRVHQADRGRAVADFLCGGGAVAARSARKVDGRSILAAARRRGEGGDQAQCGLDLATLRARRSQDVHALQRPRILRQCAQRRAGGAARGAVRGVDRAQQVSLFRYPRLVP